MIVLSATPFSQNVSDLGGKAYFEVERLAGGPPSPTP